MVAKFDTTRNQRLCGAIYLLRLLIETVALIFEDQSFAISVKFSAASCARSPNRRLLYHSILNTPV